MPFDAEKEFWLLCRKAATTFFDEGPKVWKGDEAKFYRAEKAVVTKHLQPFYHGMLSGCFLFLTFRISGSRWFASLRQRFLGRLSPTTPPPGSTNLQTQGVGGNHTKYKGFLERKMDEKSALKEEASQLPFDIFVSIMCGLSVAVLLLDRKQILDDFVETPLLPGKSLVHQHVCPDALELPLEFMGSNQSEESKYLQALVKNCLLRRKAQIDIVPYPGLKEP